MTDALTDTLTDTLTPDTLGTLLCSASIGFSVGLTLALVALHVSERRARTRDAQHTLASQQAVLDAQVARRHGPTHRYRHTDTDTPIPTHRRSPTRTDIMTASDTPDTHTDATPTPTTRRFTLILKTRHEPGQAIVHIETDDDNTLSEIAHYALANKEAILQAQQSQPDAPDLTGADWRVMAIFAGYHDDIKGQLSDDIELRDY